MGGPSWVAWAVLGLILVMGGVSSAPNQQHTGDVPRREKLLYILLDGFRWDYVDKQRDALPGFTNFLRDGVRARWTTPLFPSLSYPTWTTLVTGQYAETHGIVGNYFYDPDTKEVFSLFDSNTTGKQKWWTSEPIWITAEKAGIKTAQYLWARCDVPFDGVTTSSCEYFRKIPGKDIFFTNIMSALDKFQYEDYDFVQVYTEHADNTGHNYGPDSEEVAMAIRDLDDVLTVLLDELEDRELADITNIVIVSDHGMTYTAPGAIERHEIDQYLDINLVENIADKGALMNIKVPPENVDKVYQQLSEIPNTKVYKKATIPEEFHYKNNKYVHEIVLLAEKENFLMSSKTDKQLPLRNDFVYYGAHGYTPDIEDMRGIFFAKGPAFRKNKQINPIHVVDVYQVLTTVLGLTPQPHNGTWDAVKMAFDPSHPSVSHMDIDGQSTSLDKEEAGVQHSAGHATAFQHPSVSGGDIDDESTSSLDEEEADVQHSVGHATAFLVPVVLLLSLAGLVSLI
ncbi:glycerophosphocholine cholinephosphodiesterase ENPP6-like [Palaemon carinicauda]|uniref:glycerophosphocholine cholinephosphodiesterase ENPP6-like n=1 Tax=Palaemon carinicauda TaxID=392227 RepID=UPI0035B67554